VEKELRARGLKVEMLDGDVVRENLSKGLSFSKEDRDTNIRRIGFVCELLTRNDVIAITAAISPYRAVRDENRARIGRFVEVYAKCPIDVLAERDVKGLYKKALAGEIKNFTGIDDPYEEPLNPEIVIESDKETPEQSAQKIIARLEGMGYLRRSNGAGARV
jgi:adenylyl-sulfate kinase